MGYKKLSNEQELQLVQEYIDGAPVKVLMERYGFATKKSIMDKVKKHYPDNYKELVENAKNNRKGYNYKLEKIENEFDAYYLGLLLTDGYIVEETDSDAIARAEAEFTQKKAELTYKEDAIDMKSKKLDAEISSLSTEYETVKQLISKSIEKTFQMFQN